MQRFFVYNPVFAWVIAAFILLFGLIGLSRLPVEQYPDVAPPSLTLAIVYPGADAQTLDRNVTSVIEKELNGVENYLYMSASSRSNGTAEIIVTFEAGTDLDIANTQIQDRLTRADPRLPAEVRLQGIKVTKSSSGFLMIVALQSKDGTTDAVELGNFASTRIMDELKRLKGVGDVILFGSPYAMRIWLDPEKLAGYGLTPSETLTAVQEQNSQTAGGGIGEQPVTRTAEFTAKILTENRFATAEQFEQIIIRANTDGSTIRLGDVARVELGADSYNFKPSVNGRETAAMAIQLQSGANALATATAVRDKLKQLQPTFPPDMTWTTPYDITPFIKASVENVVSSLVESIVLVFVVMFVFLQSWRATLIPALVVPIALAGSCLGLFLFGFSINTLSLFGMVMAVGILVDDAIVVVENVERIMSEEGLSPRRATVKAMGQITGAIVGITLVLIAVFVPMAFFPGSTGAIYRQFSVTLAVSIFFSAILALTLTPALCAALLRPHTKQESGAQPEPKPGIRGWAQRFFNGFNRIFAKTVERYGRSVGTMLKVPARWLMVFVAMAGVAALLFTKLPGGFLPSEDQGYIFLAFEAAPGATQQRTEAATHAAERFFKGQPEVRNVFTAIGYSFFGQGQGSALMFVDLHPWGERKKTENSSDALVARANAALSGFPGATIITLAPPPIQSLGNATGFTMKIEDRSGVGGEALLAARGRILTEAMKDKTLAGVRPEGPAPAPQLSVDIDRIRARALGLTIADVNSTLAIAFGSVYANDFIREGSVLRVYVQASAEQRMTPDDVLRLRVRNGGGEMVPFSAFTTATWTSGPQQLDRYNGYPAVTVSGQAAPGQSSGTALQAMDALADKTLLPTQQHEWTGTAYEEKQAGGQIGLLLGLSLVIVFLLLAALYESWPIPLAVLLVVPFGVLGTVVFTMLRGFSADVYFNVGLIAIIGLSAKNAILIVEFAIGDEKGGKSTIDATVEAARQRLRPIIMTSLAFILGMVPLAIASGAGAASRQAIGTGVIGGMIFATAFGIFFTPVFFVSARKWLSRNNDHAGEDAREAAADADNDPEAGEQAKPGEPKASDGPVND